MNSQVDLETLIFALQESWIAETSASSDDWTEQNPSFGQCAVTALVVQDYFGGRLLRAVVCGESHYWNELSDGTEIDLTRNQFPQFRLDSMIEERDREYVLGFEPTRGRYELLREQVKTCLSQHLRQS